MNATLRVRFCFLVTVAGLFGSAASLGHAQNLYFLTKGQVFDQTSSAAPVADPGTPFYFSAQAATNVVFTLPTGGTVALPFSADNQDYEIDQQPFATKAALDTAYPAGTYKMTGTGIPAISFNLTTDLYPTVTPQITNGTWNAGGLLVVDPTQAATITFNTFTGYTTAGVAGHMQTKVQGLFDNVRIPANDDSGILSVANPFGITTTTTPLTSIVIPAHTLINGGVYQASVQFDTASTFDATTVSGAGIIALYSKTLTFYIAAQAPGTSTPTPVIIGQPANQTGVLGGSATFSLGVSVGGSPPGPNLQIQWYFNGQPINLDGTKYATGINNNAGLTVKNLTAADVGSYSFTLINAAGIVTSQPATLTLATAAAPAIVQQPVAVNVGTGTTAVFSVLATGTPGPLTYQWKKDGAIITPGANGNGISNISSATLVIQGANPASVGNYTVTVSNSVNSVTSNPAALTVTSTNDPGRLTNLSVLTDISAATPTLTVATVVGGGTGSKPLVVRAVGPSLGALGVPGTIPDPQLTLFNSSSAAVASNDNWGGDQTLLNAMVSAGGFAFTGPTSKDAAAYQPNLAPGNYSMVVSGVNGSTGTVIAEIYDSSPLGPPAPGSSRLIDVSVLKPIASGGSLTLGFTLNGSVAKTVLIRVIGPGLAAVGLTSGTLGDPQLTLFNSSSTQIASNDDWGADPQLISAATRAGAFNIGNAQTKDAVLLVTLPPGAYTATAKGNNGTSGTAIVEVYEVP